MTTPPKQWARAAAGWNDHFFQIRISNESDPERLTAVIEWEAARPGETRRERIATCNKRLAMLRD